jgi:hypothetical protein
MLLRTLKTGILIPALLNFAGCRTTTDSETKEPPRTEIRIPEAPPPDEPEECPIGAVVCSQEYDPVLCSAGTYAGQVVDQEARLVAWGTNACSGKIALQKEACRLNLRPSKLGQVQCVPDASEGNCPPESLPCPDSTAPTVCTANAYGDQNLPAEKAIKAWGSNANLAQVACRQNLNPKALKKIVCTDDPSAGECPPPDKPCHEKERRVTCKARKYDGKPVKEPMEAKADSACEAKKDLARQACKRSLRPSAIDEIVCVFEK